MELPFELRNRVFSFYFRAHDPRYLRIARSKLTKHGLRRWTLRNKILPAILSSLLVNTHFSREALAVRQKETRLFIETLSDDILRMLFPDRRNSRSKTFYGIFCQGVATNIMGYQNLTITADVNWLERSDDPSQRYVASLLYSANASSTLQRRSNR